jgi:CYTH domain-containing protein
MVKIKRKYLLKSLPAFARGGTHVMQGYLSFDEHREVRIRRSGERCFLTIKEGIGQKRRETEIEITLRQFQDLWPTAEGRRLEKVRTEVTHRGIRLALDRYLGDLEPLMVAGVTFSSVQESAEFRKPDYFGQEITKAEAYKSSNLALHGLPHGTRDYQVGALPYLFRGGQLHLVIVSNSAQSRWIIPKGQPEPEMPRQDVAVMEAMEEAGVIGSCPPGFRVTCHHMGARSLYIYPLKVTTVLKKWPEMGWRKRAVLPLNKALKMISEPDLSSCIQRIASHLIA